MNKIERAIWKPGASGIWLLCIRPSDGYKILGGIREQGRGGLWLWWISPDGSGSARTKRLAQIAARQYAMGVKS
jgi:hypothetical protein